MNKLYRLSIPVLAALMILVVGLLLAKEKSRALAADTHKQIQSQQGSMLVTTLEDELIMDGDCSLREALEAANTNTEVDACGTGEVPTDTITFDVAGTIIVTSQLQVKASGPLIIDGGESITVSGGGTTRVWWVDSGSSLILQNLNVVNGYINGGNGAGIYSEGTLSIIHSILSDNHAADASGCGGGGIHQQGGMLTVVDSTISRNSATCVSAWGGGIVNQFGTAVVSNSTLSENISVVGGGILNFGTMTVTNSALFYNYAYIEGGAIHNNFGSLVLIDSTLSFNYADYSGGLHNSWGMVDIVKSILAGNNAFWGGGIMNQGSLTVTNSTLSGNHADDIGGGIYNTISGTLTMTNTTLFENDAVQGGALYNENALTVTNSIVASSPTGGDCWGIIMDGGHNISSDDTCGFSPANGSLPDTDPLLKPLQYNGGPTWTHALKPGSPAIDTGDDARCPPTDQRGITRPIDGNMDGDAVCDIGSFEAEYYYVPPDLVTIFGPNEGTINHTNVFTGEVEPFSTSLPLTYTWQAAGQPVLTHTGGLTDVVAYLWESPGVFTVSVSVANAWGIVTDAKQITITDLPIEGLLATNDSPTLLGEITTLTATITGGTNVSYTWDFGDGETGNGQVVTHTYALAGIHTATVTAQNTSGSVSVSTLVTISPPIHWQFLPYTVKYEAIGTHSQVMPDHTTLFSWLLVSIMGLYFPHNTSASNPSQPWRSARQKQPPAR